jgi:hypothetical protein
MKRPFIVTSYLTFDGDGAGYTPGNLQTLLSPYGGAWWLDEIILMCGADEAVGIEAAMQFRWCGVNVALGVVPFGLFGASGVGPVQGFQNSVPEYRWKLPKPLWMPNGEALIPTISPSRLRLPITITSPITVAVAYVGHAAEPGEEAPKTVCIPHVTAFVSSHTSAAAFVDESVPPDLSNPFDVPVFVQGMRTYCSATGGSSATNNTYGRNKTTTVRILSPNGNILVRDKTLFGLLGVKDLWNMPFIIPPRKACIATFEHDFTGLTMSGTAGIAHGISIAGYREVTL